MPDVKSQHIPVMTAEVVSLINPQEGEVIIDATLGDAGHSQALLAKMPPTATLISFEIDPEALADVVQKHSPDKKENWIVVDKSYTKIAPTVKELNLWPVHKVLFDFGISTRQVVNNDRGFSFHGEELDMRMNSRQDMTAARLLNLLSQNHLTEMFFRYGSISKRVAERLAKKIIAERDNKPFGDKSDVNRLNKVINQVYPASHKKGHPSTVPFQAIRIAVNDEFTNITDGLNSAWEALAKNGLIITLTYHSGEHQLVDDFIKDVGVSAESSPQPAPPSPQEVQNNPRSRSAQLRWIRKKS